jgi:DNA-binding LacI/PurR family transcriptional regulator
MSITEVAKIAGVSVATVSRVINGHASVQPQLARRVRTAMQDTGYTPRLTRPGPKPKISRTKELTGSIGIVLLGRTEALLQFPYMSRLMAGIADAVHRADCQLMVLPMPDKSQPPRAIRDRLVDGLILTGMGRPTDAAEFDQFHPLPCVWVGGSRPEKQIIDHVLADNSAIGTLAADYLLECGCKTAALIDHSPDHAGFDIRRKSFSQKLKKQGISVKQFTSQTKDINENELWSGGYIRKEISLLLDKILKSGPLPDGIFLQTDQQAAVLHALLRDRGIHPEKDVTLISCNNDEPWRTAMIPCPATIDPQPYAQGLECFSRLDSQIKFGTSTPCSILISPKLIK